MGVKIYRGRRTAADGQPVTLFIIGMRINKLRQFRAWFPVFKAMPDMLRELYTKKEYGFLSHEMMIGWRSITLIQYWRSTEELLDYAHHGKHLKAWQEYYRTSAASGAVGIFHETYEVTRRESIYNNMPALGLGKAVGHAPVKTGRERAQERLDQSTEEKTDA
ncbi:DUF4188 domain-containing protein [Alkalicoccus urumqiensis]|uniref:DUF4188 domain-containing protein n=1 Tax=Alkalicoccus urumqiensis TaxID=1548213 RepID=A0A2P6MJS7_ALKUR|nr:DUF4188 domain-containing protein [Alkalicoccus urumqiensis]PRO66542.1 DUF4188 domain-containing protein [Alkalicoccus urumqiensis]